MCVDQEIIRLYLRFAESAAPAPELELWQPKFTTQRRIPVRKSGNLMPFSAKNIEVQRGVYARESQILMIFWHDNRSRNYADRSRHRKGGGKLAYMNRLEVDRVGKTTGAIGLHNSLI
jgi:hypothetical protein